MHKYKYIALDVLNEFEDYEKVKKVVQSCDFYQMQRLEKKQGFRESVMTKDKNNNIYLEKRPEKGIWGGLWSFIECDEKKELDEQLSSLKMNYMQSEKAEESKPAEEASTDSKEETEEEIKEESEK